MKLKATILIVLVAALVALLAAKGVKTGNKPEEYSSDTSTSQAASLIEEAKQKRMLAWLLFHSTS